MAAAAPDLDSHPAPDTHAPRPWRPLWQGGARDRVQAVIDAIGDALESTPPLAGPPSEPEGWGRARALSLCDGHAGFALFHGVEAAAGGSPHALDRCGRALELAVVGMASIPIGLDLYAGASGIAWVMQHLGDDVIDLGDDDPLRAIDRLVLEELTMTRTSAGFDLISGLVGLGVYALERLPRAGADRAVVRVVDHLAASATWEGRQAHWLTLPEHLPDEQRAHAPRGRHDLGMAHGVAGIIAVLAQGVAHGVDCDRSTHLLTGAVTGLLARRLSAHHGSVFPAWVEDRRAPTASRVAWCYGDLGVGLALFSAAAATDNEVWRAVAMEALHHCARRDLADSSVVDAPLCHGAAGVMHGFNRAYQATGDPALGAAAQRWCEHLLDMGDRPGGVAGFEAWHPVDGQTGWVADPGFICGAAGIGLALSATLTETEPRWDRCLLTAIPGTTQGRAGV